MKKFFCALLLMTAVLGWEGGGAVQRRCLVFGDSADIDWSNPSNPSTFISMNKGRSGTSSLCDSNNTLLLYAGYLSDGTSQTRCRVYNKFHTKVLNGDSIFFEPWYHSILFVPKPSSDSIAFLFSNIVVGGIDPFGLYYSIINYKTNIDSGLVVQKIFNLIIFRLSMDWQ
ncbi:MAG: hypothetical protein IPP46_02530 [Bacteroidetes bacterium]|nr:hypothetical protein [Bacteroidota bacterium]